MSLPEPLLPPTFGYRVKVSAVFLECQDPVSCCFKDKGPEKSWRSQILRYYPVTQKTVPRSDSAVAGVLLKAPEGKKEDTERDQ